MADVLTPEERKVVELARSCGVELTTAIIDRLVVIVEAARAGATAVRELINQSHGVDGLHRNGDVATWEELLRDGRYEEWLLDFCKLEDALVMPAP